MRRLERAKRRVGSNAHVVGTTTIAFTIDGFGALATETVASGSGSASLDQVALSIARQAAPFPASPPNADTRDSSFVLPIHFR